MDRPFTIGEVVYVRCKVIGPALLAYGSPCIVLDLIPLDSENEETGSRFTVTPREVIRNDTDTGVLPTGF